MKGVVNDKLFLSWLRDYFLWQPALVSRKPVGLRMGVCLRKAQGGVTASAHGFFLGKTPSRRSCGNCGKLSALLFFAESFPSAVETGGKITERWSSCFGWFFHSFHSAAVSTAFPARKRPCSSVRSSVHNSRPASPSFLRPSKAVIGWSNANHGPICASRAYSFIWLYEGAYGEKGTW